MLNMQPWRCYCSTIALSEIGIDQIGIDEGDQRLKERLSLKRLDYRHLLARLLECWKLDGFAYLSGGTSFVCWWVSREGGAGPE